LAKLLGISASKRAWGNCDASVKATLAAAMRAGAETDFIRLTDLALEICTGCFKCLRGDRRCPIGDDLYGFLERLEAADALVLGAPVYFLSPPAILVALLDRLLVMGEAGRQVDRNRPAVTLTLMGNARWRGVAEPLVNMTVSLLGFRIVDSVRLVAEGPGEITTRPQVMCRLDEIGSSLAVGDVIASSRKGEVCPVCGSDFFRIEPPELVCPICGSIGDLERFIEGGGFVSTGGEPRWGLSWLDRHIEAWVSPSVERYKDRRRAILKELRQLKQRYTAHVERGKADVH
jgi:putative NADPH-quinone reductase